MMKIKDSKKKIIWLITVIALITIILGSVIIRNTVMNQEAKEGNQLAGANQNSELIANNIKKGVTIGGITGTLEILDTSDATATPEDILEGKIAYANGNKIVGKLQQNYRTSIGIVTIERDYKDVNCGFQPKYVIAYSYSINAALRTVIYDNGEIYAGRASMAAFDDGIMKDEYDFIIPLSDGFRFASDEDDGTRNTIVPEDCQFVYIALG